MAQYNLGAMYFHGRGVAKDVKKAFELYTEAAKQGNVTAENNLGFMYEHGLGVHRDFKEAVRWYERAAKSGEDYAQRNLGEMYEHGVGARRNYSQALTWYKKAAAQGHAHAQMRSWAACMSMAGERRRIWWKPMPGTRWPRRMEMRKPKNLSSTLNVNCRRRRSLKPRTAPLTFPSKNSHEKN